MMKKILWAGLWALSVGMLACGEPVEGPDGAMPADGAVMDAEVIDDASTDDASTDDAAVEVCRTNADCETGERGMRYCSEWQCMPGESGADAMGCVEVMRDCGADMRCDEALDRCVTDDWCSDLGHRPECEAMFGSGGTPAPGDCDGDGFLAAECAPEGARVDCDDMNPAIHPDAQEICNPLSGDGASVDEDCEPSTIASGEDGDFDGDRDGDGYIAMVCCNGDTCGDDCNDEASDVHPDITSDTCNGRDDNCNGMVDEDPELTFYRDVDGDGYGVSEPIFCPMGVDCTPREACSAPAGYALNGGDCNDGVRGINPSAAELCDTIDNNCDTFVDEDCACTTGATQECGPPTETGICARSAQTCVAGMWPSTCPGAVYPETTDGCGGGDQDCDGRIDEDGVVTHYYDNDGDTYGDSTRSADHCPTAAPSGYVLRGGDCDDSTMTGRGVYPGAPESCDGLNNDCNATTADGSGESWLGNLCDGGDADFCREGTYSCTGGVQVCSDVTGDAADICDGIDNDCDPSTADGFGDSMLGASCDGSDADMCANGTYVCAAGMLTCNEPPISTVELCDGMDNDCDASTADGSGESWLGMACDGSDTDLCQEGTWVCSGGSRVCTDDTGDAADICDGIDNDCDPSTADGFGDPMIGATCDGDDVDLCANGTQVCTAGTLTCNESPVNTTDICDGTDNDCDGRTDEGAAMRCDLQPQSATMACNSGSCEPATCTAGYLDCNPMTSGCETDLRDSLDHCGACMNACPARDNATRNCTAGGCGFTCDANYADCNGVADDGCEVDLSQLTTCGSCSTDCGSPDNATPRCADTSGSYACALTCSAGFDDCNGDYSDGCESELAEDENNCGACGNACATGQHCQEGVCASPTDVASGSNHSCALHSNGQVECWGRNHRGQLGDGTLINRSTPVAVLANAMPRTVLSNVTAIAAGGDITCARRTDAILGTTVWCWGNGSSTPTAVERPGSTLLQNATQIVVGTNHACAVADSRAYCWGDNAAGQLGTRDRVTNSNWRLARWVDTDDFGWTSPDVVAVAAGDQHSCLIRSSGRLYCWGENDDGQLGYGNNIDRLHPIATPVSTTALVSVYALSAGEDFSCACISSTLQCWGNNSQGQLGTGSSTNSETPIQVRLATGSTISCDGSTLLTPGAGSQHVCTRTGRFRCWGRNTQGQLGDGSISNRTQPVEIPITPTNVAAGTSHSCAVTNTGSSIGLTPIRQVSCWGANGNRQLGDGTTMNRTSPVVIDFR